MNTDDMIIVSVDDHVVEPPDLFQRFVPDKYKDVAPHVVRKPDGSDVWQFHGIEVPNVGLNAVAGRPPEEYGIDPTSFDEIRDGCFDIEKRILDMNANGMLGSLCFPSLPGFAGRLFAAIDDKDAARVLAQAYNDWHIDEWCGTYPGRFIPLSIPLIWDPQLMAEEIHRVAKKGCHAVTFAENPEPLGLPSLHSDHWDPFWKACSDEGTVVCMHIGSSSKLVTTAVDAPIDVLIVLQPMNIVQCAADLIHSPVFKKFPDLTVALSEGGIGWIPYFLERLDHSYRVHKAWTGADFGSKMPSEVFLEHVVLCFISDPVGVQLARRIGVDRITVEIDYPHSDTTWPRAPEKLATEFAQTDLTDDEIDQITYKNAMGFFSYDPFTHRPKEQCTVGALRAEAIGVDVEPRSATGAARKPEREGRVTITDLAARAR
ncbi:MAG TPA: amidohydrolase family protein [Acidimicrobiia bacterium]|nr:amidohydrolase family protein [Acidimicrobiia bacterium]